MKLNLNFGIGGTGAIGAGREVDQSRVTKPAPLGGNSACHATTDLVFRFLIDFWNVGEVHEIKFEFWHWR